MLENSFQIVSGLKNSGRKLFFFDYLSFQERRQFLGQFFFTSKRKKRQKTAGKKIAISLQIWVPNAQF